MKTKHLKMIVSISLLLTLVFAFGAMTSHSVKAAGLSVTPGLSIISDVGGAVQIPWWTGGTTTGGGTQDPDTNPATGPQDFLPIALAFSSVSTLFSGAALLNKKRK